MTITIPAYAARALATATVIGLLTVGGAVPAAMAADRDVDLSALALTEFRANLTSSTDIEAFDALNKKQQRELAAYLLGETDPFSSLTGGSNRSGDFEVQSSVAASTLEETTTADADAMVTAAATSTKTVSAWQSFLFAGITISKTTVRETYYVSGGKATGIASYSCTVNVNYDPFSSVTSSKSGAWISSGKATAECKVVVKRGIPTPWGTVSWSTASNIQYVTGNGYGSVTSHGWR